MPESKKRIKNRNHSLAKIRSKERKSDKTPKGRYSLEQLFGQVKKIDAAANFKLRAAARVEYIR